MYDSSEALEDPQAKHLEILVSTHHETIGEFRTVRPPVTFDGQRTKDVVAPPVLGEHNGEVLDPIRERIQARQAGVV
jgi:crotonobetainyl-CoA:carnitine CoA-transferase CaiB-like acyl-CoA transferase